MFSGGSTSWFGGGYRADFSRAPFGRSPRASRDSDRPPPSRQPGFRPRRTGLARGSHLRPCRDPPRHGCCGDRQPLQPRHLARCDQSRQMGPATLPLVLPALLVLLFFPVLVPSRPGCRCLGRLADRLGRPSRRLALRFLRVASPSSSSSSCCFQAPSPTSATSSDMTTSPPRFASHGQRVSTCGGTRSSTQPRTLSPGAPIPNCRSATGHARFGQYQAVGHAPAGA